MAVRVNSVSIGATSTSAAAYSATIPAGTGIIAGDLIIVCGTSDGTHASNGMSVLDNVNNVSFTTIKDQQQGSSSTHWQQTFYYVAAANVPDGSLITFTPYAAATTTTFSVDIFRYALGTIVQAVVGQTNVAANAQTSPALGAAPPVGSLVFSFDTTIGGAITLTQDPTFTAGSITIAAGSAAGIAYAVADGVGTFASTWTDSSSQTSATQTVALKNASVGVPYAIGSSSQAPGSSSTVVTVAMGSQANDALFVVAGCGAGSAVAPTGVTDSKSHTWTLIGTTTVASGMAIYVYQSLNAVTTMVAADTVTVAWSGTNYAKNVLVLGCSGISHSAALDQSVSSFGSGTDHPVVTTQTALANNNELAIAIVTSGFLSAGVTWAPGWTDLTAGGLHNATSVYTSVAVQGIINNPAPVNASAYLGATAVYAQLLLTFLPDPPVAAPATLTINTSTGTSTLPPGTVGSSYSNTLTATGGSPPYTWSYTGSLPTGLTMSPGGPGGNSPVRSAGWTATAPTGFALTDWVNDYTKFGFTGHNGAGLFGKMFPPSLSTWQVLTATPACAATLCAAYPGFIPMLSWTATLVSASAITTFCNSVPAGQLVAFSWQSEQEGPGNTGAGSATRAQFQTGMANCFAGMHASGSVNSKNMFNITSSYMPFYQGGGDTSWLPPPSVMDGYGADEYYHLGSPPANGLQDDAKFQNWLSKVRGFGKPLALTEYGIDINNGTAAVRDQYLQRDVNWVNQNFGPGKAVSQFPLFGWMYWDKKTQTPNYGPLTDATAINIWGAMCKAAQAGTGGGTGGVISGTPTGGGTFNFTARVTDSAGGTTTKALTIVVAVLGTGLQITTTGLNPGNVNIPYSATFFATGGVPPYTWSTTAGSPPAGMSLAPTGILSGTPSGTGTSTFTVQVLDSVGTTATAPFSLAIGAGINITTTTLPPGVINTAYSQVINLTGGSPPFVWTTVSGSGNLPLGLVLDQTLGIISGTPTTAQVSSFIISVTDNANQTDTQPLSISISGVITGGSVGRRLFGGDMTGWTFAIAGGGALVVSPGATVTFYSALTGGSQYVDLQDTNGLPITSVTTDSTGEIPPFLGPDSIWMMAADANNGAGPRKWYLASDVGNELTLLHNAIATLGGFS